MAEGFGDRDPLPVAQTRNWKAYGLTAVSGIALTAAFVWFVVDAAQENAPPETTGISTASSESLPPRKFEPIPTPAPPPPVVIQAPPLPPPAAIAAEVKKVPPLPPEPMTSMFAMGEDGKAQEFYSPTGARGEGGSAAAGGGSYRPGSSDGVDRLGPDDRQGLAAQKNRWLSEAGTGGDDFVLSPKMPPISRFMIQAGTIISATTLNSVNSDLPGDVVALINSDVLDTPTGTVVLIPASAKLYGRYNNQLAYGAERAQIAWLRILFPDGSSQNIGSMAGTDESGAAGVEGDVDRHPWRMALAVGGTAFFSVLSQAGQIIQGGGETTIVGVGAAGGGNAAQNIGQQIINRELNRPNTLTVPAGSQVAVMLSKDVALPPYVQKDGWQ